MKKKISLALKTTSIETLEKLSDDEDYHIRTCVAQNHNTPVEILDKLSEDVRWFVRNRVASNPNTVLKL